MRHLTLILVFLLGTLLTENKAHSQGLDFDAPDINAAPSQPSGSIFENVTLGGALDYRFISMPSQDTGFAMIHVNELVVTAQITDSVSLLAEQILPMSRLVTGIEQDHGFVYATITNLPIVGPTGSLKVGRFRAKFGADSRLDAAANIARSLVYRNLGIITDTGLELSVLLGPVDFKIAVMNGPDFILENVPGTSGQIESPSGNKDRPIFVRFEGEPFSDFELAASYYDGPSFLVTNRLMTDGTVTTMRKMKSAAHMGFHGSLLDQTDFVYKQRGALDFSLRTGKFTWVGEGTYGRDKNDGSQWNTWGALFRSTYNIKPGKWSALLQWDKWADGRDNTVDENFITAGLSHFFSGETLFRAVGSRSTESNGDWIAGLQMLLSF